jgi:drug/metabolite transporter (DMT)-like permease
MKVLPKRDLVAILCLIGAVICWGIPPVMLRHLTHYVPDGFTTNLIRYPVATIVYLPFVIAYARRRSMGNFWRMALIPAIVNILGQTLFAIAPYYLEAGKMAFLFRLSTVFSILGAFWLFPDERKLARNPRFWLGAGLAVIGFLMMSFLNHGVGITRMGIIIALACSFFWGMYDISVRYTMKDLHPLIVFGVIGNYTSIGMILLSPLGEPKSLLHLSPGIFWYLVLSAYIGIGLAHGMYYYAIQRLGVAVSSLTMMLTPFISILGSSIFLGERFSGLQWVGGVVLILGASVALWARERNRVLTVPPPATGEIVDTG